MRFIFQPELQADFASLWTPSFSTMPDTENDNISIIYAVMHVISVLPKGDKDFIKFQQIVYRMA